MMITGQETFGFLIHSLSSTILNNLKLNMKFQGLFEKILSKKTIFVSDSEQKTEGIFMYSFSNLPQYVFIPCQLFEKILDSCETMHRCTRHW